MSRWGAFRCKNDRELVDQEPISSIGTDEDIVVLLRDTDAKVQRWLRLRKGVPPAGICMQRSNLLQWAKARTRGRQAFDDRTKYHQVPYTDWVLTAAPIKRNHHNSVFVLQTTGKNAKIREDEPDIPVFRIVPVLSTHQATQINNRHKKLISEAVLVSL